MTAIDPHIEQTLDRLADALPGWDLTHDRFEWIAETTADGVSVVLASDDADRLLETAQRLGEAA